MSIGAHCKVVTVLFCDVVGSTALEESVDPEALQVVLARYFERLKGIFESQLRFAQIPKGSRATLKESPSPFALSYLP